MRRDSLVEAESSLFERDETVAASDDQVIQHVNIQQLPGLDDGTRNAHVVGAGRRVAGGVVVYRDDRRGQALNSRLE